MASWGNCQGVGLTTDRSQVQLLAVAPSGNDSGQVVHARVRLSPSSIILHWPKLPESMPVCGTDMAYHPLPT